MRFLKYMGFVLLAVFPLKYGFITVQILHEHVLIILVKKWFESPANATCACPGEILTYNCTVEGGRATIWGGSAIDCAGNDITFRHDNVNFIDRTIKLEECNGAIVGQSVDIDGTYYISQLNITVSNRLNDKTVTCISDSMTYKKVIGKSRIKVPGK